MPTPSATRSTLQVGTYNPTTDTWSLVLDLNDNSTFYIHQGGLTLDQPQIADVRSFNIRASGERVLRQQYKNRHIMAEVWIRSSPASTTTLLASIRTLMAAVVRAPYRLRFALPGASVFSYADVVKCTPSIPSDPQTTLAGAISHVKIDFECLPGFSADQAAGGTRVALSNLLVNPGFEAPSGPAVTVFNDLFSNTNAYTVQAGGALTQDTFRYSDAVLADSPLRYYRLDEASGTTIYNAMGGNNGTATGAGITYGTTGLLTGDSDTALTFNGSTGWITAPTTGLPTGNANWSIECWIKIAANPSANAFAVCFGGTTNGTGAILYVDSTGHPICSVFGTNTSTGAALTLNTPHHLVGTWDGTTLRLYLDGNTTPYGTATPGTLTIGTTQCSIATDNGASFPFPGIIDEVAIYGTTLSSTRVNAHYVQGTTTPTSTGSTMVVPSGGRISFGSPIWSSVNLWQVRFRYLNSLTATWYLHYTDANNYLAATITGTALALVHKVAGVTNTLNTQSINLVNGMQYYLQVTQFPPIDTFPQAQIQAVLKADSSGFPGTLLATAGPIALSSNSVANSGQPQIQAAGAALGIGGNFGGGVNSVALFGPGGWTYIGATGGGGTSIASGGWDTNTANTYPNGPVTSYGAARIDAPAAGTWYAAWLSLGLVPGGAAPNLAPALPNQVQQGAIWVKSSGLNSTATIQLIGVDCDSSGSQLRSTIIATLTGNQSGWVQMTGNWTTGASTAYVEINPVAFDGTTSPSAIVWWDNAQLWNQTTTGQTTMPYCELRQSQAPAQLLVSGLLGDIPAPAYMAFGTWFTSWAAGSSFTFGFGRRQQVSAGSQLVGNSQVYLGIATAVLDSTAFGGYYLKSASNATAIEYDPPQRGNTNANLAGIWQFFSRFRTTQATVADVTVRLNGFDNGQTANWVAYGTQIAPILAANTWQMVNEGPLAFPLGSTSAITPNLTTSNAFGSSQWADSTGGGSELRANWYAYFPVDGNLLYGTSINPSNGSTVANSWQWSYNDALGPTSQVGVAWKWSTETKALPNPSVAVGGAGTSTSSYISVNPAADQALTLDPRISANSAGVNQIVALMADQNAAVLAVAAEIQYAPLYLYPK